MVPALRSVIGGYFLVGKHGAKRWAPVDGYLVDIGETATIEVLASVGFGEVAPHDTVSCAMSRLEFFNEVGDGSRLLPGTVEPGVKQLQEYPLCPAVVVGVCGCEAAIPVI